MWFLKVIYNKSNNIIETEFSLILHPLYLKQSKSLLNQKNYRVETKNNEICVYNIRCKKN